MEHLVDFLSPQLRALVTVVISLAIVLFSGVYFLPFLHRLKYGQSIREEGPASHQAKSGTPTMGGVMIVLAVTVSTLLFAPFTVTTLLVLFIFLGHFLLGFADDYIKVVKKRNLGLRAICGCVYLCARFCIGVSGSISTEDGRRVPII